MIKIAGLCSGHDCSYAILEDGIPILHNELERFTREKEPIVETPEHAINCFKNTNIDYLFFRDHGYLISND